MAIQAGNVVWTVDADLTLLNKGLGQARRDTQRTIGEIANTAQRVGFGLTAMGATLGGALGLATKAAMDFESGFAGVAKTINASDTELAAIERQLRKLALTIPVPIGELNKIAETAGAVGVSSSAIVEFTRVVAALGVSSNLAGEEGATMMARFANITKLPQDQFQNLASAIVHLGNNGASTEKEIMEMGLRLAGAGNTAGLSQGQILGLANALSSVGLEAEAGGSAFSRVIIDMASSVANGGKELKGFADVAGMSATAFAAAFRDDPAAAVVSFVEGLASIHASGKNVFGTLEALGFSEIRVRDALLRASSAGDMLSKSMDLGVVAMAKNVALTTEAEKRYATTASQIQLFRNSVNEMAITLGQNLLPVVGKVGEFLEPLIGGVRQFATEFPGATAAIMAIAAAIAAMSLALGPLLIALPGIVAAGGLFMGAMSGGLLTIVGWPAIVVGAVAAIVAALYYNWDTVINFWAGVWTRFADALKGPWEFMKLFISNVVQEIKGYIEGLINIISKVTGMAQSAIGGLKSGGAAALGGVTSLEAAAGGGIGAFASGGTQHSDGWAVVGERGPELVKLPGGAQVFSNEESRAMGASVTVNMGGVTVRNDNDIRELSRSIATELRREMRGMGAV